MKVVFRVDASHRSGIGHLIRCLTLARALRENGCETGFVCRAHAGNMIDLLRSVEQPVEVLPAPAPAPSADAGEYGGWLGVTQAEDSEQTIEVLRSTKPDWLVVDHYGLDASWESRLRGSSGRIMVIDDMASVPHDCDLLLNQNYSDDGQERYETLVSASARLLLGPRYALMRPEYAEYRGHLRARTADVSRVLVFFGGSDLQNMTGLALEALSDPEFAGIAVDVVVGANHRHRRALEMQSSARLRTELFGPRPHLADLMSRADLAIGAGGATTWERMCLGLPALVITIADNQIPTSELLAQRGLLKVVGRAGTVGVSDVQRSLAEELVRRRVANRFDVGMDISDGLGVPRVIDALQRLRSAG